MPTRLRRASLKSDKVAVLDLRKEKKCMLRLLKPLVRTNLSTKLWRRNQKFVLVLLHLKLQKLQIPVCDMCLVKMEKAWNLGVGWINRKRVVPESFNPLGRPQQGISWNAWYQSTYCKWGAVTHIQESVWHFVISCHYKKEKGEYGTVRYFERDHIHITFTTVYCYGCSILLWLFVNLLLDLIYKLIFIIGIYA